MKNIPLLIFDTLCLPVTVIRLILIYFAGSRYNIKGFTFLDVMQHAQNPYFNQQNDTFGNDSLGTVDVIDDDYRVVIRDDSRIYPLELNDITSNVVDNVSNVIKTNMYDNIGETVSKRLIEDIELVVDEHLQRISIMDKDVKGTVQNEMFKLCDAIGRKIDNNTDKLYNCISDIPSGNNGGNNGDNIDINDEYDIYDNNEYDVYDKDYDDYEYDNISEHNNIRSNSNTKSNTHTDIETDHIDMLIKQVEDRNRYHSNIFTVDPKKQTESLMNTLDSVFE